MPATPQYPLEPHSETFLRELRALGNDVAIRVVGASTNLLETARKRPDVVRAEDVHEIREAKRDLDRARVILESLGRRWGVTSETNGK